jgi:hypothetical protein
VYRHLNKLKSFDLVEEQACTTFRCAHCEVFESGAETDVLEHAEGCNAKKAGKKSDVLSQSRKGYRIRYGNITKSWNFVEAHVKVAMEGYRKTVDHLNDLVAKELAARGKRQEEVPQVVDVPLAKVKR